MDLALEATLVSQEIKTLLNLVALLLAPTLLHHQSEVNRSNRHRVEVLSLVVLLRQVEVPSSVVLRFLLAPPLRSVVFRSLLQVIILLPPVVVPLL